MGSRWSSVSLLVLAPLLGAGATMPVRAQQVRELGMQVVGVAADEAGLVAGPIAAVRPSSRVRISLAAGAGAVGGEIAGRAELLGHFLLDPGKRRGVGVYGAAGVAAVAGPFERGYLVLAMGVEGRPGARAGWTLEAGVGGGARLAAGYRRRWGRR